VLLIDDGQNPVGECFWVQLRLDACVADLLTKLKEDLKDSIPAIPYIKVWKVEDPASIKEGRPLFEYTRGIHLCAASDPAPAENEPAARLLSRMDRLSNGTLGKLIGSISLCRCLLLPAHPNRLIINLFAPLAVVRIFDA
jgi:hypothetical protein